MKTLAFTILFTILGPLAHGQASSLSATSLDGQAIAVSPGGVFSLNVTSQTRPATGLAYAMIASRPGIFTLIARDVTGSPFTVLDVPDGDSESGLGVLGVSALLDPNNGSDLGADTEGFSTLIGGTQHVAKLTFRVADNAPLGAYTISPTDQILGGGYYDGAPDFESNYFDVLGAAGINVVAATPEPPLWIALLIGGLLWRRHKNIVNPYIAVQVDKDKVASRKGHRPDANGMGCAMVRRKRERSAVQAFPSLTGLTREILHSLPSYHAGGIC
jgi:hypothetical protein